LRPSGGLRSAPLGTSSATISPNSLALSRATARRSAASDRPAVVALDQDASS
jgi:hypothetical protein